MHYFRYIFLPVTLALFTAVNLFAQDFITGGFEERKNKAIAELKKVNRQDTARANALINVASAAFIQKQRKELLPYFEEAISLCRNLDFTEGLAKCYLWKGQFQRGANNRDSAHIYYDSVISLVGISPNSPLARQRADANWMKAWLYNEQENFYTALNHFFEALKYYEAHPGTNTMHLYTIISNTYYRVNNIQQAIVYSEKNAAMAEKDTSKMLQAQAYVALAGIYIDKGELDKAVFYLDKMKAYMPDPLEVLINFAYYQHRGEIHYKRKHYDSSFLYYNLAHPFAAKSGHVLNKTAALFYLSNNALKLGKLALAKKYADENLKAAEERGAKIGKINALLNLSDYYHETGNNGKAYDYLQKAVALKDSLLLEANVNQINTLAAIYETDKKQKEIFQLQTEKYVQSAAIKEKSFLNKLFIAAIAGLLVFIGLIYRIYKNRHQLLRQEKELQQQKITDLEKDKQLLTIEAMLKGQEEERGRIAKDLHDGLGGMLSGTKLSFINFREELILTPNSERRFVQSVSMLDNTIGELRKVAHNLMPEVLLRFGLEEALRDFCSSIQASSGIKIIYQQLGNKRKLENPAETAVYRIVQELVNNALKHAGATQIVVQLTMHNDKTTVTVEDNGKGFDNKKNASKGAGLINIQHRVNYFKGSIDIDSEQGNGTSVTIELKA